MEFKTIPDVEVVSTGTYPLGSGETTFTPADLADAVLAASDPTIVAPRIKLGHSDPRFNAGAELDAEPAFGTVANMRLAEDGHKIIADLQNVPAWLADSMQSAYPGRSIEGGFSFDAPSGKKYRLVISNLALLGTTWPGVTSLDDLKSTLERNGEPSEAVAADGKFKVAGGIAENFVVAKLAASGESKPTPTGLAAVLAAINAGAIPRHFAADIAAGKVPKLSGTGEQAKWWARSIEAEEDGSLTLIVDDAAGHLIRVPASVKGETLDYGTPALVTSQPLAASGKGPRVLASWAGPAEGRETEATMDVDVTVLRKRLGLAEDANEDAIKAALAAEGSPATPPSVPDGMALVDESTLSQLREGAQAGTAVAARLAEQDRDNAIEAAISEGKFAPARREHYAKAWDADPNGTKALIASLQPGLVPVSNAERGRSGDGDGDPQAEDAQLAAFQGRYFPELARTGGEQ